MPEREINEATPGVERPVDPESLYLSDGTVDFDAVERYLDSREDSGGSVNKTPNELDQASVSQHTYKIELNEDIYDTSEIIDPAAWREKDPTDFAVYAYLAHIILGSINKPFYNVSPSIESDPAVSLDFASELDRFLDLIKNDANGTYEFLEKSHDSMKEPENNVNELECVVAIPVAGHQEYNNIYHSLEQFAKQKFGHSRFEIHLLVNLPGKEGENDKSLFDSLKLTTSEIDRFKKDHPDVKIRGVVTTYRGDPPTIGAIRADLWNNVAYDMKQRGRDQDIMVISSDADIVSLSPNYLTNMVSTFEHTDADIVAAELRWQPAPGLPYNSLTNRILRYQSFLDIVRDNHSDTLHTADANTGISLATYMAVGGYNRNSSLGEMNGIVNRILYYRQPLEQRDQDDYQKPEHPVEAKATGAVLRTHSRRLILAMALGYSPYNAWDQNIITFGTDDALRTEEMQVAAAEASSQAHAKEWIELMTPPYTEGLDPVKKERVLRLAHKLLGFDKL